MFKTYFKTAYRSLVRNGNFTVINIAGLAVGIAVCMMIFMIIQFHKSFDNFHSSKDHIYRLLTKFQNTYPAKTGKDVPFPLPEILKSNFGMIEQVIPVWASHNDKLIITGSNGTAIKAFREEKGVFFTRPSFFKIFDFPLLAGTYESLNDPNNVLLTKEVAEKYFGDWKTAPGKTIRLETGGSLFSHASDVLKVSGILATIPANTDFQIKLVVSYGTGITEDMAQNTDWTDRTNSDFGCYLLLPPDISADKFNEQLREFTRKMVSPDNSDCNIIQPLSEVHYDTLSGNYGNKTMSRQLINVLWIIASFILIIACINFINLSTAQAVKRAKESGIRKVLGSKRYQLQIQFIVETSLTVTGALILAFVITVTAMPYMNQILDLSLHMSSQNALSILLFLLTIAVVVTAIASFYPSVVLSRFTPVNALKSNLSANSAAGISLRRGLVIFQFIIAQALIIGTIMVAKQMSFFIGQPTGFDTDAIINVPFRVDTAFFRREDFLKQQLLSVPGVQSVSFSSNTPAEDASDIWSTFRFDHALKDTDFKAITKFADNEYLPVYKLQLIAGRNLQPSQMTREFLVNESLVKSLGITNPDEILNREISIWDNRIKCPVVGVLKDFHNRPLRNDVAPMLITTNRTMYSQAAIKLDNKNLPSALQSVKTIWEQTIPGFVYEYRFFDDKIAGFYKQESQLARLYQIFAAVAIFLSCLGVYGLALFMAAQRSKEVGIRKVYGAGTGNIVILFSLEFIMLVALAFVFAVPIAWFFTHNWLSGYAYRTSITWWVFAAGGLSALIITLATVSSQAIKAAFANPVDSIRSQ